MYGLKTEDFQVLWVARYDYPPGWKMKYPHNHNYYQMIYVTEGEGEHLIGDATYVMRPARLYFIKPFLSHQITKVTESDLITYDLKFRVNDPRISAALDQLPMVTFLPDTKILDLFKTLREEWLEKKTYYKELASVYLIQIILNVLRLLEADKEIPYLELHELVSIADSNKPCNLIIDFIQKHYQEDLTLKQISESLGYNPSYICQVTKKMMNLSIMRFLNIYRIHKSKDLIRYSDYSLKQIATMVGFKTVHHFTRLFKEVEGTSPAKWREEWREKEKQGIRKDVFLNERFKNKTL